MLTFSNYFFEGALGDAIAKNIEAARARKAQQQQEASVTNQQPQQKTVSISNNQQQG